jgi:transposase-like protein
MHFKKRTLYSDEFKQQVVVDSLRSELTIREFVAKLPISEGTLRSWRCKYMAAQDPKEVNETAPKKSAKQMQKEIDRLKKELTRSKLEVEILKKTREYFNGPK